MAKIRDASSPENDARLIAEQSRTSRRDIEAERRAEDRSGFSITGRTGAQRDGHPNGWNSSR